MFCENMNLSPRSLSHCIFEKDGKEFKTRYYRRSPSFITIRFQDLSTPNMAVRYHSFCSAIECGEIKIVSAPKSYGLDCENRKEKR